MNLPRIYLIAILLLAFGVGANGQSRPKAVLVDEFANEFCTDPLRSKIDNFLMEISQRPDWVGYVIKNADQTIPGRFERYFNLFHNHAPYRGFDVNKIKLYRREEGDSMAFQFWVAPPRAKTAGLANRIAPQGYKNGDVI